MFERRCRRGAVVVSAGVLLCALNMAAVAHAEPESAASEAEATEAATARDAPRPSALRARATASDRVRAVEEDRPARRGHSAARPPTSSIDRHSERPESHVPQPAPDEVAPHLVTSEPATRPVPPSATADAVADAPILPRQPALADPPAAASFATPTLAITVAAAPEPPVLTSAMPTRTLGVADTLAWGSATPLPSALAK